MTTPIALTWNTYVAQVANLAVMQVITTGGVTQGVDATFNTALQGAINYAELRIQRDLDLMQLFSGVSYTTTAGNNVLQIPLNDFVTLQTMQVNGTPLLAVSNEYIQNLYTSPTTQTGQPALFAIQGGDNATTGNTYTNVLLAPTPDSAYSVYVRGTTRIPSLYSYANPTYAVTGTTFISTWLPDLLIQASMIFISGFQRNFSSAGNDPQMPIHYEQQYGELLRSAQAEEARRKFASSGWTSYSQPANATQGR